MIGREEVEIVLEHEQVVELEGGGWQLLRDGQPYFIKGPGGSASKETLAVYADGHTQPWVPSGWMGGHDALSMNLESTESPHRGGHYRRCSVAYSWAP